MKIRSIQAFNPSILLGASLLVVILLVGCAPAPAPTPTPVPAPQQPTEPVVEEPVSQPTEVVPTIAPTDLPPTEVSDSESLPPFLPRGDELEASTPSDVKLASGGLQLVEFFRFT
jgi:hypothetical protein